MTGSPRSVAPLVIEFVGGPGAGKSTLLPVVADACRHAGLLPFTAVSAARPLAARTPPGRLATAVLRGRERDRVLWLVFRCVSALAAAAQIARSWPLAARLVRSQRDRPAAADAAERRVLYWLFRLAGVHALFRARGRPGEVLLLDEGYVHRVVQLFSSAVEVPDADAVAAYLDLVPAPDLVIAVETPPRGCVERVRDRGVWARLTARSPAEVATFVVNAHAAATLAGASAAARGWPVITADNGGDARDTVATALVDACAAFLDDAKVAATWT